MEKIYEMKELIKITKSSAKNLCYENEDENKNYWKSFYNSNISNSLSVQSKFAEFTLILIKKFFYLHNKGELISLLDIGCGNGRDLNYFRKNGIDAYGIDLNSEQNTKYITSGNALNIKGAYDVYYLRFFVHTLTEKNLDKLINKLYTIIKKKSYIFLETRSSKGITNQEKSETNFKSKIGDEHFRMLYSCNYLIEKLEKYFNIYFCNEDKGLAPFRGEDPYVIRMILNEK
tara:strand:- start:2354 stop:3046 length:693 start_codon:yes stop_codon:yes gene_type:complete